MASKPIAQSTRTSSRAKDVPSMSSVPARTTRAKTAATAKVAASEATTSKPASGRKRLVNRDNAVGNKLETTKKTIGFPKPAKNTPRAVISQSDSDREPIMAYLRIRPRLGGKEPSSAPYLEPLSDTSVRMTDPNNDPNNPSRARYRISAISPSSLYTFSHIFPSTTQQSDFFAKTTLPLVRDLLNGQNALLFTYGVTNSGKTYTIQGGTRDGSAGILPRTLDVIFNSVEGLHSDGRYRPVRLQGIEIADGVEGRSPQFDLEVPTNEPALAEVLAEHLSNSASEADVDPTVLKLDRNYEYSIWLSYAEVYNEKAYDLLDSVSNDETSKPTKSGFPRPAAYNQAQPLLLTRKALSVKPSPASDAFDSDSTASCGKYIAGIRQFRIHSASEAKALVRLGQLHRRVFGTLANSQSSRSHGLVTIKVVRGNKGDKDDPTSMQVSRLTLVDLAGSERTKHTHTTGDRLKEAGSINKSLMVLGQCMEVMRANQKRVAQSLAGTARTDTKDIKRGLAVVPFRHSKLTEVLMDYFIGDSRAVMIVNVNPYDTGFDENSHVMKFAALAREVCTTPTQAPIQRAPSSPTKIAQSNKGGYSSLGKPGGLAPVRRQVIISTNGPGRSFSQAHLEVLEEDEETGETDDDDEPINPLVDALFDEVEELRMRLFESEMRCATIEAETREEVIKEMEERMRSIEKMYARRLMNEMERNEMKTDAKIDMLHQSGLFGKHSGAKSKGRESEMTDDIEEELFDEGEEDSRDTSGGEYISWGEDTSETGTNGSLSPLTSKTSGRHLRVIRQSVPDGPECLPLISDGSDNEATNTEDEGTEILSLTTEATDDLENAREDDEDEGGGGDEEEWVPHHHPTPKARASKARPLEDSSMSSAGSSVETKLKGAKSRISHLKREMQGMTLYAESDSELSAYIPSSKKTHPVAPLSEDRLDDGAPATAKKKQRTKPTAGADKTPMAKKKR